MLVALASAAVLAACGTGSDVKQGADVAATAGKLVLRIEGAESSPAGRHCAYAVTVRNDTGAAALNVQAAWMAQTEGFGIISDYRMLGDFAADEARSERLTVVGAPCNAVRDLTLTRAVCTVGPAQDPPQSCADQVVLDGGTVVSIGKDE